MFMQLLISHGSAHQFYQFDSSLFGKDKRDNSICQIPLMASYHIRFGEVMIKIIERQQIQ